MTVKPFVGANTTTVVATTENGGMTLDQSTGRVTVTFSATTTGAIAASLGEVFGHGVLGAVTGYTVGKMLQKGGKC